MEMEQECHQACKPKDNDIYCLNPLVRMRNEHNFIELHQLEEKVRPRVHHTTGVVLTLCNGKRTVRDIAKIVVPFLKNHVVDNAEEEALSRVKAIISNFSVDPQLVDKEHPDKYLESPSRAWLVPISLLSGFRRLKVPIYDSRLFLPENAYPEGKFDPMIKYRAPVQLLWHLTSDCMTNCRYCFLKRRNIPKSELISKKRIIEIVQECKDIGVIQIMPQGGDILLYPYLFDFFDAYEAALLMPVQLSTKAYISKEIACQLAQYSTIYQIQFSIDSTIEEIADYLTRTSGYCKRIFESIENVLNAGISVFVKAVITPYNILTIPRLYRELHKLGVRCFRLAPYGRSAYHHTEDLFNHNESYEWLLKEIDKLKEEFPADEMQWQDGPPQFEREPKELIERKWEKEIVGCSAGRSTMMVCADGKIIPCEQMPETEEFFCGDLKTQTIQEVWDGDKLNSEFVFFRQEQFEGTPCYKCKDFSACINRKGYCFRDTCIFLNRVHTTHWRCPQYDGVHVRIT